MYRQDVSTSSNNAIISSQREFKIITGAFHMIVQMSSGDARVLHRFIFKVNYYSKSLSCTKLRLGIKFHTIQRKLRNI